MPPVSRTWAELFCDEEEAADHAAELERLADLEAEEDKYEMDANEEEEDIEQVVSTRQTSLASARTKRQRAVIRQEMEYETDEPPRQKMSSKNGN